MRITVLILFGEEQHPLFAQKLDDLRIRVKDIHAAKVFDLGDEISCGVDRVVDLEAVFFPDVKVVGSVTGCSMDTSRSGFSGRLVLETHIKLNFGVGLTEGDVFPVHYQRRAIEPGVLCFETIEF